MRLLLPLLLAASLCAGEAADPVLERLRAGFTAWTAAGGSGKAACALWTEGGLPAAVAEADVVAGHLDAVPAAARKQPDVKGPINGTILSGNTETTSTLYLATIEAGDTSVVVGFGYSGTPPRLASMASASGASNKMLQDRVKLKVRTGLAVGRTFNPGHRTELTKQAKMADDALGPYTITAPAGVKISKLVVWGPAVGKPVEIPVGSELSLVSLHITAGEKPTITCTWTPAAGAAVGVATGTDTLGSLSPEAPTVPAPPLHALDDRHRTTTMIARICMCSPQSRVL